MKPLTLEEAKANIGKEVYLLPHTKPYGYTMSDGTHKSENLNYNNIIGKKLILVSLDDEFDVNVRPFDCDKKGSLEVISMHHLSLAEPLKIGDTVKLDPSTMPYTFFSYNGDVLEKEHQNPSEKVFIVTSIHNIGDVSIGRYGYINPRHLIKVEEETMTADQLIKRNTVQDATCIGVKSKLFSIVLDETRFLWINNQWIECHSIDDDFEPVTVGIDTGEDKVKHKPQYTPEEVELRERIAFKLLEQHSSDQSKIGEKTDLIFKIITGK